MKNMFRWRFMFMLIASFIGLLANTAWAESNFYGFVSKLDGAQQVPSNSSLATGFGKISYDPATNILGLSINVSGISTANLTGAHIHLGATGSSGPIILDLGLTGWQTTATGISLNTTLTFPEANELELINGNTYLNLHTSTFTGGEIRGQNIVAAKLVALGASIPYAVSADGSTVVGRGYFGTNIPPDELAFRWTASGGVQVIGAPSNAALYCDPNFFNACSLNSTASSVSANGEVIAGYALTRQGSVETWEPFRWTAADGFLSLGNLALFPFGSWPYGISDDGTTIVGAESNNTGDAFRWTAATGEVKLPKQAVSDIATAYGASGNGAVSVGYSGGYGALWPSSNQLVKLNPLIGGFNSSATAISSDASVIVGNSTLVSTTNWRAVSWSNGSLYPVALGDLTNESGSYSIGVSGDGKTIAGIVNRYNSATGKGTRDGFVWTEQTGKRLIPDLLTERGMDLSNLQINDTGGISRDASTLIGSAVYINPPVNTNPGTYYIAYLNPAVTLPLPPAPPPPPPPPTPSADLAITMTDSPDPVKKLSKLTYGIVVKNNGSSTASSVTLTDTLPSSVTFLSAATTQGTCSGTTTVNCALGNIANGASANITITVRTKSSGTISNTASTSSTVADPNSANNKVTITTTVK